MGSELASRKLSIVLLAAIALSMAMQVEPTTAYNEPLPENVYAVEIKYLSPGGNEIFTGNGTLQIKVELACISNIPCNSSPWHDCDEPVYALGRRPELCMVNNVYLYVNGTYKTSLQKTTELTYAVELTYGNAPGVNLTEAYYNFLVVAVQDIYIWNSFNICDNYGGSFVLVADDYQSGATVNVFVDPLGRLTGIFAIRTAILWITIGAISGLGIIAAIYVIGTRKEAQFRIQCESYGTYARVLEGCDRITKDKDE